MNMERLFFGFLMALLILFSAAYFAAEAKKISKFGFKCEAGETKMIVDTEITRLRSKEAFIPLLVWLGHSEPRTLFVSRESFKLVEPDGTVVSMPSYEEFVKRSGGNTASYDYQMMKRIDDYGEMSFLSCKKMGKVLFFPDPSNRGVLYDNVEMPNRSYFRTLMYFPNTAKDKSGTYKLVFEDAKGGAKLEVPFAVEWMK